MYKVERIQKIKDYLLENKQADVGTLGKLLGVSDATIRTDFIELEKEGYITRFHGGAALNAIGYKEDELNNAIQNDNITYDSRKEELGIIASHLVKDREWIFLGPGTTSYYIAKALSQRNSIHVLTNNLLVANTLGPNPHVQTLLLGGQINSEGLYTMPENIQEEMKNIYLSKAFFSIDGADIESGYTLSDINVMNVINFVTARTSEVIFAIDSSKYGKRTFMKLCDITAPHTVITNDTTPTRYKQFYMEHDIPLYTSSAPENTTEE